MFKAAIALLGVIEYDPDSRYFMQSNKQSNTPDVMAAKQVVIDGQVGLKILQMEIVTLDDHASTRDIVEFLKQTKYSDSKCYSEYDLIVLCVNTPAQFTDVQVNEALKSICAKASLCVVGKPDQAPDNVYLISMSYPTLLAPKQFDIAANLSKMQVPPRVVLVRGRTSEITYEETGKLSKITVYDVLGIDESRIVKMFGIREA